MNAFVFSDVKEITFFKEGNEIKARIRFERNLNAAGKPSVVLNIGVPENFPYGRYAVEDVALKLALKTWIEDTVLPEANSYFGL